MAIPGATVIPHGIEVPHADDRAARQALGIEPGSSSRCASASSPRTRASSSCSTRPRSRPGDPRRRRRRRAPAEGRDEFAADLRQRYGHAARFTGWVPEADVSPMVRRRRRGVVPLPQAVLVERGAGTRARLGTPVLLSPALARCAGAPSARCRPWRRRDRSPPARAGAATRTRSTSSPSGRPRSPLGRSWPAVARQHAHLYEEMTRCHTSLLVGAFGQGNPGDEALCEAFCRGARGSDADRRQRDRRRHRLGTAPADLAGRRRLVALAAPRPTSSSSAAARVQDAAPVDRTASRTRCSRDTAALVAAAHGPRRPRWRCRRGRRRARRTGGQGARPLDRAPQRPARAPRRGVGRRADRRRRARAVPDRRRPGVDVLAAARTASDRPNAASDGRDRRRQPPRRRRATLVERLAVALAPLAGELSRSASNRGRSAATGATARSLGAGGRHRSAAPRSSTRPPTSRRGRDGSRDDRLVIAMRFHALVAAGAAGTPALAIAHEPKLRRARRRLGQPAVPPHASAEVLRARDQRSTRSRPP